MGLMLSQTNKVNRDTQLINCRTVMRNELSSLLYSHIKRRKKHGKI